ncbi:hypothetical protein SLA2020_442490 [Shorea laevis]
MNQRVGPTDDEGQLPSRSDVGDDGPPELAELRGGELAVLRVDLAEEVVGDAAPLVGWDFVGGDVEALVDLHFVGVDDLGLETGGEVDGKFGFSGARGPHDDDDLLLLAVATESGDWCMGGGAHARPAWSEGFGGREKEDFVGMGGVGRRG